jgi:hypothetical protein
MRLSAFINIKTACLISVKLDAGSHFYFGVILIVLGVTLRKGLSFIVSS